MYGYKRKIDLPYQKAITRTKESLKEEGFGVLTEIDVKSKLKEKLNVEMSRYIIIGACNPPNAHKAIMAEHDIGLMLPCNVIIYETNEGITVAAIKPTVAMQMINNKKIKTIAREIESRLQKVIDNI